jgi:hypothetical protein
VSLLSRGIRVCDDLSNAVTLDDVSELISCGVQAWLLEGSAAISFGNPKINQLWQARA